MAEKNLKEIFELRIEYLKRSEDYKNLCESARETGITLQPVPEQYKGKGNLLFNYVIYGDIYKQTFEETLFKIESWKEIFSSISAPLEDYSEFIGSDIDRLMEKFKKMHGREPSILEIKADLLYLIKSSGLIYLMVNLSTGKQEDLKINCSEILKEQKKLTKKIPSLIPNPGIRLEELERYLRVFDYRKDGLEWDKIVSIEPHSKKALNNEQAFKRDLQYAKKIIKNVENGIFPGKYH